MSDIRDYLSRVDAIKVRDAERWKALDGDLCQMCHAYGNDKRSLLVSCFYDVHEVLPEAIWLKGVPVEESGVSPTRSAFYLRICKSCRARFLGHLRDWRADCIALRDRPKDHDGDVLDDDDPERNIPVRIDGATVMLTREEWLRREAAG